MNYCENCAKPLKPDYKFCGHCGATVTVRPTLSAKQRSRHVLILLIVLGVALIAWAGAVHNSSSETKATASTAALSTVATAPAVPVVNTALYAAKMNDLCQSLWGEKTMWPYGGKPDVLLIELPLRVKGTRASSLDPDDLNQGCQFLYNRFVQIRGDVGYSVDEASRCTVIICDHKSNQLAFAMHQDATAP